MREFQFQIDKMFGCSGTPFSCDVEIRHANQVTVLPIEIQVYTCTNILCLIAGSMACQFTVLCRLKRYAYDY